MTEFGTRENPSIGGVPWNGSIYLDAPAGLSPEEELMWRLDHDLVWVMENLITILDKDRNRPVPFRLNRPQRWAMWNVTEQLATGRPSWNWNLKGRQFGYSTLFMTVLFIGAMRGQNGLLLAQRELPGMSIFSKGELALKSLPRLTTQVQTPDGAVVEQVIQLVPPPTSTSSRTLMSWLSKEHSAVLRRDSAENRDAGVGETFQNAQFTEAPLYPDAPHTIGHILPALARKAGTFVNGEFTARGEGDYAHSMWLQGLEPGAMFRSVFSAWNWHTPYQRQRDRDDAPFSPEELQYREWVGTHGCEYPLDDDGRLIPRLQEVYAEKGRVDISDIEVGTTLSDEQLLFRRDQIRGFAGDLVLWRSEFPANWREAFRTAGRKLIATEVMDKLDAAARDPLAQPAGRGEYQAHRSHGGRAKTRWVPRQDGRVHRFELPRADSHYVVWCDPSSGAGVDPTGAGVYRVEYEKVFLALSFEGFERPHEIARLLARIGRHYRTQAQVDSEKKLVGGRPSLVVVERNGFGEHVIHELDYNLKYGQVWRYTDTTKDNWRHGHDYGFPTTKATKMPMLQRFAQAAFDDRLVIPCRRVLGSMRAVQYLDDEDKTAGAPKGQHDDLAMGGGIGFHAASEMGVYRIPPRDEEPAWLNEVIFERSG